MEDYASIENVPGEKDAGENGFGLIQANVYTGLNGPKPGWIDRPKTLSPCIINN